MIEPLDSPKTQSTPIITNTPSPSPLATRKQNVRKRITQKNKNKRTPPPAQNNSKRNNHHAKHLENKMENLNETYENNKCANFKNYEQTNHICNKTILDIEKTEHTILSTNVDTTPYLYPSLNDPNFNAKIALKQEFNDTKYDGPINDVKSYSDFLNNAPFELSPHQAFVKNFLSFQTPYNSLLLYHGLGSGKTCSAIGVCEEQRDYLKQSGIIKPIIIVASPNVQDNFRLQLFDERKLIKDETTGMWNMNVCTGNKLLKEINPTNMKSLSKQNIVKQINDLINRFYTFVGYIQFSNMIENDFKKLNEKYDDTLVVIDEVHNIRIADDNATKTTAVNLMKLVQNANNIRLLLLSATPMYNNFSEIIWLINLMNINDKRGAINATDIFNSNGEFKNDETLELFKRKCTGYISFVRGENPYTFPFRIYPNLFSKENTFDDSKNVYPKFQMNRQPIKKNSELKQHIIPVFLTKIGETQMLGYKCIINELRQMYASGKNVEDRNRDSGDSGDDSGNFSEMPSFENMETFGFKLLQKPLEALTIIYPVKDLREFASAIPDISTETMRDDDDYIVNNINNNNPKNPNNHDSKEEIKESDATISNSEEGDQLEEIKKSDATISNSEEGDQPEEGDSEDEGEGSASKGGAIGGIDLYALTGKSGLKNAMNFDNSKKSTSNFDFEYAPAVERIFSREHIGKYSSKIKCVCDSICALDDKDNSPVFKVCDGIVLIYSQQLYGGVIPIALALEEMGFSRYGSSGKSLFKTPPTMDTPEKKNIKSILQKSGNKYVMITGNSRLSPDNDASIKALTSDENTKELPNRSSGSVIKVVIISKAGSEGIDLKAIRQIHILDPWYNMNRIEQIIGRGVRNFSHKMLPFEKRNVQIFLYATLLSNNSEEAADLYVYRVAEKKAQQIGKISRVLKQTAVDCILNHEQTELTQSNFKKYLPTPVKQEMSTNGSNTIKTITDFYAGDAPYSAACDYMEHCDYDCKPDINKKDEKNNINSDTYNEKFVMANSDKIVHKIKSLFKTHFFYKKKNLIKLINYPLVQIYAALSILINDNAELMIDAYGRTGKLINIGEYYLFQPSELNYKNTSLFSTFDRDVPVEFKHASIKINMDDRVKRRNNAATEGKDNEEDNDNDNEEDNDNAAEEYLNQEDDNATNEEDVKVKDVNKEEEEEDVMKAKDKAKAKATEKAKEKSITATNTPEKEKAEKTTRTKRNLIIDNAVAKYNAAIFAKNKYEELLQTKPTDENLKDYETLVEKRAEHKKKNTPITREDDTKFKLIKTQYETYKTSLRDLIASKELTNDTWYNSCGIAMRKILMGGFFKFDSDAVATHHLNKYLISHIVDVLPFNDKIDALNYLYGKNDEYLNDVELSIKKYFTSKIIKQSNGKMHIIFYNDKTQIEDATLNDNSRKIFTLKQKKWTQVDAVDEEMFNGKIKEIKDKFAKDGLNNKINNLFGFIGYESAGGVLLFKIKDINNSRNNTGARCDQSSKIKSLNVLNTLVKHDAYFTNDTTKGSPSAELCAIQEFLFRYYDDIKEDGKTWFLTPEYAELYNIERCKIKNNKVNCE